MKLKTKPTEVEIDIGDDGYMSFRELSAAKFREIITPYNEIINEKGTGEDVKERLDSLQESGDHEVLMSLANCFLQIFGEMVCGWRGITDEDGNDLPFCPEAIAMVCQHDSEFVTAIVPVAIDALKKKNEASSKNLKPGQSGILSQAGLPADTVGISEEVTIVVNAQSQDVSTQ